jgi:LysM repeat protein
MRRILAALALAVVLPLPVLADITVKPGETLSEIAERHGVSVNQLMRANGIKDPTLVQVGQRLVIPGRGPAGGRPGGGGGNGSSVVVNPGDTLSEIAERNGISLQRLMQLNGISNPAMVEAGRRLVISGGSGSGGSRPSSGGGSNYTVKTGETLGEIAERFNTSVNRLMQLNGISDPTQLQAGSRLVVPGARQASSSTPGSTRTSSTKSGSREHVVKEGETLSEIADAYNLSLQKLVSLNSISDPNLLMSGTRLKLTAPPPVRTQRPTIKPAQAAAPTKPKPKPAAVAKRPQASGGNSTAPAAPVIASTTAAASRKPTTTSTANSAAPAAPVTSSTTAAATRKPSTPATTTTTATTAPATDNRPAISSTTTTATSKPTTATGTTTTPSTAVISTAVAPTAATRTPAATKAPASNTKPATNTKPVVVATATGKKPETPDWRTYGPLQVDWAKWQSMGGSYVAPSLNASGQLLYTAINCGARKLNATSPTGQWKTWERPSTDAEQQLVSDLCKAKGS